MTGKGPWITLDGEEVADSQLSIERLADTFDIELYPDVSQRDESVAESLRVMVEEYLYWIILTDR